MTETDSLWRAIRGRRSVRHFRPEPLPRAAIMQALEAASWAPSPHGRQPWRFAVIARPAWRAALADAMAATWRDQLRLDGQDETIVAERLAKSRERIVTAPVAVLACLYLAELDVYPDAARQRAEEIMAIQSLGAAIQNMLLAAYAAGVESGWMCAPLFCPEVVRQTLDLPEGWIPHALITMGSAARDPRRRPRRPVETLVHWIE